MAQAPGTVSKILWHFTGGPKWDPAKNRQEKRPKPESEAYEALLSILKTGELRLGQYREVVRVEIQRFSRRSKETGKRTVLGTRTVEMQSSPVCCLSDIPIAHLSYLAKRYGKIVIGFHRDAVVKHGFNPVFYTLQDTQVLRSIRRGFRQLEQIDTDAIASAAGYIESETNGLQCENGHDVDLDLSSYISDIEYGAQDIGEAVASAQKNLEEFLSFVKTFDTGEFSTIYCEREWRSTMTFAFSPSDLAMIVLPKNNSKGSYFNDFVGEQAKAIRLPRSVPIVPWEDLIEH